jgi:hypothetical protein
MNAGTIAAAVTAAVAVGALALVTDGRPPSAAGGCPAAGHVDPQVSGVERDDIPTLPPDYSFAAVASDGCTPVRWNPCRPVRFVVNPAGAPPGGPEDVREAFRRVGEATGIAFVDDGVTDERSAGDRPAYQPERYGRRWAPVLVEWRTEAGGTQQIQLVGVGLPTRSGDVFVSGRLSLNPAAVTDARARTPLAPGFGPTEGMGPVGPSGVTWGRVVLHELAHVVGLGHTRDPAQLMYPETTEQTTRPARFAAGDRAGLRHLGRGAGCLHTPPPGSPTTARESVPPGRRR